jgi:hypothetical protein
MCLILHFLHFKSPYLWEPNGASIINLMMKVINLSFEPSLSWELLFEMLLGAFGSRFWANQAHGVQASGVWLPAPPPEPGSPDAISLLLPASPETPETDVSAEPGSTHAAVSPTNDVLVYN